MNIIRRLPATGFTFRAVLASASVFFLLMQVAARSQPIQFGNVQVAITNIQYLIDNTGLGRPEGGPPPPPSSG